ncbi:hypothetical protein M8542_10310 [Amycolatopsis sp. OK19-0408]|uniref:Uncharacterized protein n=1 Tax=Amycolatopsis iheyensis TaxID=2945988 RepID=A0A9X2N760_9PSEU|nr:hypothetical protein [Amycolatopsis iheyensis]MCR6483209.1 hypothetical protein [Amycolatopsis iheyensis]
MAGTSFSVLTPSPAERAERVVIAEMAAEGMIRNAADPRYWHSADRLPYGYSLYQPDHEIDPAEVGLVEQVAGTTMRCDIGLHVFVSDPAGRPVLGRLAQRVAERTDGWVFVEFRTRPSADLLDGLERTGRCIRVGDYVYLDASAMATWCARPAFHVVK